MTDHCQVVYQVSNFYSPAQEAGVRWNDPYFAVRWPSEPLVISHKDASYPDFKA